ncbi:MAG: hypothetical protein ACMUIP_09840 [bacterium]
MKKVCLIMFLVACTVILANCGGSSDTSSGITTATHTAVDPYIVGARFCEDVDNDGICDPNEQLSSVTDQNGHFTFSEDLTQGSTLIVHTQGTHNGVPYELNIAREVDGTGALVVSPLTTLGTKGLTNAQIATVLQTAGLTSITADDIVLDPMTGVSSLGYSVTEAQLVKLQASLSAYALLRIVNGSDVLNALSGTDLYTSAADPNGAVGQILSTVVSFVSTAINATNISGFQAEISANDPSGTCPAVQAMDIVETAVAIIDYLAEVGYDTCNATSGNYGAALAAVGELAATKMLRWIEELGPRNYAANNKDFLLPYIDTGLLPEPIVAGITSTTGVFVINPDDPNSVVSYGE